MRANAFDGKLREACEENLTSCSIDTVQVNVGLKCNQACRHCHVFASPYRTEVMSWPVMERVLRIIEDSTCRTVDVTGGSPELNPHFRRLVYAARSLGKEVMVRSNLTVLLEPGFEELPAFLKEQQVTLIASMPCYLEENVAAQRGDGVYGRSVAAMRRLNALGYGAEGGLELNLVYNPGGAFLPPDQAALEADYRRELKARHGIVFSHLLTIANMPIGRFGEALRAAGEAKSYEQLLRESFNPATVECLMCRRQISIGWDGTLYDCDFNLALGLAMDHGAPSHIDEWDVERARCRRIVTGEHCFGCTAGAGSSCGGALA